MPKAYASYGNLVIRFTGEEALAFEVLVHELQPDLHQGQLKDLAQWLHGGLHNIVKHLRTPLDPNPPAVQAREDNAVEEDERREGGKHGA